MFAFEEHHSSIVERHSRSPYTAAITIAYSIGAFVTASSRSSRSVIASNKKKLPALRTQSPLSPIDRADCEAFARELTRANMSRSEELQLIPASLARIAKPLGGSAYPTQWSAYRHARVPIPLIDKLIFAMEVGKRPPDIFPSLEKFEALWPVARASRKSA